MIQCLQFVKTKKMQETINHALQSVVSMTKERNNKSGSDPQQRLQTLKQAQYISLDDAQFIVNLYVTPISI